MSDYSCIASHEKERNGNKIVDYEEVYHDDGSYSEKYIYDDGSWIMLGYDKYGHEIFTKADDGYWEIREWDKDGHEISRKDSDGECFTFKYDKKGNLIYWLDEQGYWVKYKYYPNGQKKIQTDSNGDWVKYSEDGEFFEYKKIDVKESNFP